MALPTFSGIGDNSSDAEVSHNVRLPGCSGQWRGRVQRRKCALDSMTGQIFGNLLTIRCLCELLIGYGGAGMLRAYM
jgi:hypothetical protein